MKKRSLKALCLLLLTATLLPCILLTACGQAEEKPSSGNTVDTAAAAAETTGETEPEILKPDLPNKDWGGEQLYVLGRTSDRWQFVSFEIYAEAETGEVVNDAVYRRNRTIEEKYNVTIAQDQQTDPAGTLTKTISAGDDVYDVALLVQNTITPLAQSNRLMDLNSLEYIDFEKPWWHQELNERVSINHKLYFTTSDFMLMDKQRTSVIFFNRSMAEDFNLGNLFDIVREGKWTIDTMASMSKVVARDVDGNGKFDQYDQYGMGMERYNFCVLVYSCDNTITVKDENDIPILGMNTPRTVSTIDKLVTFCSDQTLSFFCEDYNGKYDGDFWGMGSDLFLDSRLLFVSSFPQTLRKYSAEATFDYGALPFPKLDEAQEEYHTLTAQAMLITVPVTNAKPDFAGFMLEALSAEAKYTSLPAYIETSCKTKYMYDEDSAEMLDLTFDGIIYDLGMLYNVGGLYTLIATTIPQARQNTFSSGYAAAESKAQSELDKIIAAYLEIQ